MTGPGAGDGRLEPGTRRGFLVGALALVTAPAIIRAESLMPVKAIDLYDTRCIIDYHIGLDTMIVRVDRLLPQEGQILSRGEKIRRSGAWEIPIEVAKKLLPREAHFAFTMQPPLGVQRHLDMALSPAQVLGLNLRGYLGEHQDT